MAKIDKTFVPPQIIDVTDPSAGYFAPEYVTDENGTILLTSVSYMPNKLSPYYQNQADRHEKELKDLDAQFAQLLEQYASELKGAQCMPNYPPIEYARYIDEFLTILREYRLRVSATVEMM